MSKTFAQPKESLNSSEYTENIKINFNKCYKCTKLPNYNFNKSQLYINLFTKIQLTDVVTVTDLNGTTPFDISGNSLIDINNSTCCIIDPSGYLFGNTPCGLNNYLHYVIPNN